MGSARFSVTCNEAGKRLDVFLAEKLSLTRTKIKHLLDEGHVRVDGRIPKSSLTIRKGMRVEGEIPEEEPMRLTAQAIPITILFEDRFMLAVDKPPNMVVHPSFGHSEGTLVNAVLAHLNQFDVSISPFSVDTQSSDTDSTPPSVEDRGSLRLRLEATAFHLQPPTSNLQHGVRSSNLQPPTSNLQPGSGGSGLQPPTSNLQLGLRPGIVHRLDKGTSGVILVAKDWKTQEILSVKFKERTMAKTYRTVVEGLLKENEGKVEGNIGRHRAERKKMAVLKEGGRTSFTSYKVLERLDGFTYVEVYPKTGRTHQIRVHLAHIGHPVVGDELYGKKARSLTPRPLLHAYRIAFTHPVMGAPLTIEAPVPEDMEEFVAKHRIERQIK